MPQLPVAVNVDFSSVTIRGNQFSGNPAWTFTPPELQVHNGQNNIKWTLTAVNLPTNAQAAFASSNAVQFKGTNNPPWTGTAPATQPDGTVTAGDNFQNLASSQKFYYNTNIVLSAPSVVSQSYTFDPDVENESGGGGKP